MRERSNQGLKVEERSSLLHASITKYYLIIRCIRTLNIVFTVAAALKVVYLCVVENLILIT